jgi:hypothetical protein
MAEEVFVQKQVKKINEKKLKNKARRRTMFRKTSCHDNE